MRRFEALQEVMRVIGDTPVVCNIGHPSQELFQIADRPRNFYMLGSMGLATSIGHGLALAQPGKVLVIEGDAALSMNLGGLATLGSTRPKNLVVVVIDNRANGSTGFQPSFTAGRLRLDEVARAAGIEHVARVESLQAVAPAVRAALASDAGPQLLLILTEPGMPDGVKVIPLDAISIKQRFMKSLSNRP